MYVAISDDQILHGFRRRAGHHAPGDSMGGWCTTDSSVIFGQLISGLARVGKQFNDAAALEKAIRLFEGWRQTAGPDGDARMSTYGWDKLLGGLVDLAAAADYAPALDYAAQTTRWAGRTFDRTRTPASAIDWDGRHPGGTLEWYTLGENLYRAFLATGDAAFGEFADVWRYEAFWQKFAQTAEPSDAHSVHAYSHVNSLCSLAAAYEVTKDPSLLPMLVNAADYILRTQCYATGGYGPRERLLPVTGQLGRALDLCLDHAEVGCGSWAAFKLGTYLLRFTREIRFADWMERVLHNLIGAALPVRPDGRTYYYADYRPGGATKQYFDSLWPCCSGTYLQSLTAYHQLLYFRGENDDLYAALYLPSEVEHRTAAGTVTVRQRTNYPAEETVTFQINGPVSARFRLRLRVPAWIAQATATLPGGRQVRAAGGTWLDAGDRWNDGDSVCLHLPARFDLQPVDAQHPHRCAIVRGPVVFAQNGRYCRPLRLDSADELRDRIQPDSAGRPNTFAFSEKETNDLGSGTIRPLHEFAENVPYRVYHDLRTPFLY
jgi:DUF1680 family protein